MPFIKPSQINLSDTNFPIKTKLYFHSNNEDNQNVGESLGLNVNQLENFKNVGYEVALDIVIDNQGNAIATHLNGISLTTYVKI